ncbi:unnamed protein product [Symbiodinium pilosum]|uniref:Uncharacterized protein n=1 Tax=Symbiodinium pilosum TaxID=2952 RepID=A0A812TZ29_SYMPI|nr:unnamed protein product [Symbiodinium pilosum]
MKHFLDVVHNVPATSIDMDQLKQIIKDKAWAELPDVLQLKKRPGFSYKSQYFIIPQQNGNLTVVKHYYLPDTKVQPHKLMDLAKGKCHEVKWGNGHKMLERKAFQWMLEQYGGWIHRHINKDGSPIKGWSEKLVQRALDSLAHDGCLASLTDRYDLTMQDFEPLFMDNVMQPIIPYLLDHSLWLLGEPGKGKTPLARSLAMMFSRHHGGHSGNACFRTASDFEFFRGMYFSKAIPALYDDGDISREAVKKMKAFADVGDHETILKERWNAAKFVKHQLRIFLDNSYDPKDIPDGEHESISHETFVKLLRPALGCIPNADIRAIFKRSAFVIFTKVYWRLPSQQPQNVPRYPYALKDILLDEAKPRFANYKQEANEGLAAMCNGEALSADSPPPRALVAPATPSHARIKKEKFDQSYARFMLDMADAPTTSTSLPPNPDFDVHGEPMDVDELSEEDVFGFGGSLGETGKFRSVQKRPASKKNKAWITTNYIREKLAVDSRGQRKYQIKWKRTLTELLLASNKKIIQILVTDKILVNWTGKCCPRARQALYRI